MLGWGQVGKGSWPQVTEAETIARQWAFCPIPALGKVRAEEQDGIGWGLHFVAGVEYFFVEHVGLFGEVQYSYMDFDRQHRRNANLYGFSVMGGLSIKF